MSGKFKLIDDDTQVKSSSIYPAFFIESSVINSTSPMEPLFTVC